MRAATEATSIGIVIYNTFWTSTNVSLRIVERLAELPNVVGLKWAIPRTDALEFECVISTFRDRFCVIDNQVQFVSSRMMGARGFEAHPVCYWPEWAVRFWQLLETKQYVTAQEEIVRVAGDLGQPGHQTGLLLQ